jgi:hypothetical protein
MSTFFNPGARFRRMNRFFSEIEEPQSAAFQSGSPSLPR